MIAEDDYLIACPDLLLRSEDEFYQLITQNIRRQVKLIAFNLKREDLREIVIVPDFEWGGEGCLGCDVGSGMVHWIPKKTTSSKSQEQMIPQIPAPTVIPTEPAQLQSQSQTQTQTGSPSKEKVVSVNVPSSRPVIDNLGGIIPVPNVSTLPTAAAPPISQYIHNHPQQIHEKPSTPIPVVDDIPLPKFTVPSDIINQNQN